MKRISLYSCLTVLVIISVLTLGLLVSTPKNVSAFEDLKEDCAKCHQDGRKAPNETGTPAKPAEPAAPAEPAPVDLAKPSEPSQLTEPTPAEPTKPAEPTQSVAPPETPTPSQASEGNVNNTLPIVGLIGAVCLIGLAIYLDKKKK